MPQWEATARRKAPEVDSVAGKKILVLLGGKKKTPGGGSLGGKGPQKSRSAAGKKKRCLGICHWKRKKCHSGRIIGRRKAPEVKVSDRKTSWVVSFGRKCAPEVGH